MNKLVANTLFAITLSAFALSPVMGEAKDKDKDKDKGKRGKGHYKQKNSNKNRSQVRIGDRDWRSSDWRSNDYNSSNYNQREYDRRQQTKNEWRNIAIGAGAVSVLGLLTKDQTLTFAGAAGALYSTYRYEQDRKSQNSLNRARASYFSQPYFVRDGVRYNRRTVTKNGQRHYQFVRASR